MNFFKKNILSIFFIFTIFLGVLSYLLREDIQLSELENRFLEQKPIMTKESVMSGEYMKSFESYLIDQFPNRIKIIEFKNKFMSLIGNKEVNNIVLGKNGKLLERFKTNQALISKNIQSMNFISAKLGVPSVGMFIPTSIEFYKDEIPDYYITDNQKNVLSNIENIFKGDFYTPYSILNKNKDDYIFFNSDHHWTQYGASLMYRDFYKKDIDLKYSKVSDLFKGSYYSKTLNNSVKDDYIYSYLDLGDFSIEYDGENSDSLYDKSKLKGKNKYQYFMHGDPATASIKGNGEGNVLIFKDSFSHCYIPFIANEYKNIYVVDPRYIYVDILDELKKIDIDKVFYIYSLSTLNSVDIYKTIKRD